jgi:hypothetical protein
MPSVLACATMHKHVDNYFFLFARFCISRQMTLQYVADEERPLLLLAPESVRLVHTFDVGL